MSHSQTYLSQVQDIARAMNPAELEAMADELVDVREKGGRLFLLGVGGGAANCSHAVNDFRKLCGIEAYSPVDNVSELTARTNDEGWESVFEQWLRTSRLNPPDAIFILSVGGGDANRRVSPNLVLALDFARSRSVKILGVVGRDGGHAKRVGDHVVVIPTVDARLVTPHTEAFQAVAWHCLVSHPKLQLQPTKW